MDQPTVQPKTDPKQRRSQRLLLKIPVLVRGLKAGKEAFQEESYTMVVNAHGALFLLATEVRTGQELVLKNRTTQDEQVCKVVYLGPVDNGKVQVGVEFTRPAPTFWHVSFPPEDWNPTQAGPRTRPRA